ncbi:alpha/beta fold hydrolase [Phytohabitans rumicis]|uniref:alpha/beta fold hydrolase n=1 Tax=Phytohabitans rumicis TaxID=1076125 RepID=UPI001C499A1F|nr:alpha/beta fold hydrolase [Phytohabitans rumicis]
MDVPQAGVPYADLDEVRLNCRVAGAGSAALLLVHGWGGDSRVWEPIPFAGHRVIAVDLRGHGRSSAPEGGYRPVDLARLWPGSTLDQWWPSATRWVHRW